MALVIVSVDRSRFDEVAAAVEAAGLQNMHRMPILSKLGGEVSDENRQAVEAVVGVLRVVDSGEVGIVTREQARVARTKLVAQLNDKRMAVGIAGPKDNHVLAVNVQALQVPEGLPTSVDGIPVHYIAVGTVRKRPLED